MGKSQPGSGDGLFHFQLDLPEKKKPGTTSGSRAGSQRTAGAGTGRGVGSEGANGTFQTGSVNRTYQNRNQTSARQQASSGGYGSRAGSSRTGQSAGTGSRTGASGRTYTGSTPFPDPYRPDWRPHRTGSSPADSPGRRFRNPKRSDPGFQAGTRHRPAVRGYKASADTGAKRETAQEPTAETAGYTGYYQAAGGRE